MPGSGETRHSLLSGPREQCRESEDIEVLWQPVVTRGIIRGWVACEAERNSYQLRSRSVGVRFEVLYDVSVMAPVVDESELEYRHINAMKWKNVLVN